jgi:hypothetical protein
VWVTAHHVSPYELPIKTITFSGIDHSKAVTMERNMLRADFTNAGMGPQGAVIVAAFLANCPLLVSLDLSDNELGESGAHYLAAGLHNNRSAFFSKVRLEGNWIGDKGKEALGEAIWANEGASIEYMTMDGWAILNETKGADPHRPYADPPQTPRRPPPQTPRRSPADPP